MHARATYDDAGLILHLYELRREERLRKARAWFSASFKPKTTGDLAAICPPGSDESAYYRMVLTYWEMVASFLTSGVLNRELFYQSGRELLLVWTRIEGILAAVREVVHQVLVGHETGRRESCVQEAIDEELVFLRYLRPDVELDTHFVR